MQGLGVRTVQYFLAVIGNFYEEVPIVAIDGFFGPETKSAVIAVQKLFGLPATGVVDYPTWYKISEIYVGVSRIAELT